MANFCRIDFLSIKVRAKIAEPSNACTLAIALDKGESKVFQEDSAWDLVTAIQQRNIVNADLFYLSSNGVAIDFSSNPPGKYFQIDTPTPGIELSYDIYEDFTLVKPPNLFKHDEVWAYLEELHKQVQGRPTWPEEADWELYPEFRGYYLKVFQAMGLDYHPDQLEYKSRHRFFIGTEPFEVNGQAIAGLCELAKLMGVKTKDENASEAIDANNAPTTCGSIAETVEVNARLVFKRYADKILERHGLAAVSEMVGYASDRLRAAYDTESGKDKGTPIQTKPTQKAEQPESPEFAEYKDDIAAALKSMDIPLPKDF